MQHTFKKDDPITVIDGSNWLIDERGYIVKVLDLPVKHFPPEDQNLNIVVTFPHIPLRKFNSFWNSDIPDEEKTWVYFEAKHLILGHKPLTQEEQIEQELKGFGDSMKPYASLNSFHERADHKCICEGCLNFASTHIWINIWGTGYRAHVCAWHAEEYGKCTCRESLPFTVKKDEREKKIA